MKYIYHHLGLGDHIICNGLVRHFLKEHGFIKLFCKQHNYENVSYMYRDEEKIEIIPVENDSGVHKYMLLHNKTIGNDVIMVGFNNLNNCKNSTFDQCFYNIMGLPFEIRFENFYFKRNYEIENFVLEDLQIGKDKYIFIHGSVDKNKIRNDLRIIENPTKFKIFDLLSLIENAEEVHLMESSIKCLVNSFKMDKPKFFYHDYVRGYGEFLNSKGLNKFIKIN